MIPTSTNIQRLVLGATLLGLAACAPDLGPLPVEKLPETYAAQKSFTAPQSNWPDADWWTVYGDDQLNALVAEGVANAPDLKRAEARLREADATAQQSGASLLPKLTANGSASETRASLNQGFPAQFQSFLPIRAASPAISATTLIFSARTAPPSPPRRRKPTRSASTSHRRV